MHFRAMTFGTDQNQGESDIRACGTKRVGGFLLCYT